MPPPAQKPRTLALRLKSKTLNFKFRIPHNLLPAARFSLNIKFRQFRLILKSVPHSPGWLKSKLFRIITIPFPNPNPKPKHKSSKLENKPLSESVNSLISQLFRPLGLQKVAVSVTLWLVDKLLFTRPTQNKFLLLLLLLSILLISILYFRALFNFNGSLLSSVWWLFTNAASSVGLKDILSNILAAIGGVEEPALHFF